MTYTIMGRCQHTGRIGYGIATVSLNVGVVCPAVSRSGDLIVSQAYTNRRLKAEGARRLDDGLSAEHLMAHLETTDRHFSYRQTGILKRNGDLAAHSGDHCKDWKGHITGDNWLAMGNVLADGDVVAAMGRAFLDSATEPLHERLMRALEAGRDAGGQSDDAGRHYTERSARVATYGWDDDGYPELSEIDVRVDVHDTAVAELRRQLDIIAPLAPYQHLKTDDPSSLVGSDVWEAQYLPPVPPRFD